MKQEPEQSNVEELDPPQGERRKYLKTIGAAVVGLAVGASEG